MLRAEVRADGVRGWLGPYLLAAPPPVESGDDFVEDGGVSSQDSRDSTSSANLLESKNVYNRKTLSEVQECIEKCVKLQLKLQVHYRICKTNLLLV